MADDRNPIAPPTDVIVVGAGPSGAAAAIGCAGRGLRVALLDRCDLPRERPGETLHPGIELPLRQLGAIERVLRAGFVRHRAVEVTWDGPPRLVPYGADADGPWLGFQAHRTRFDALLVARAQELGAVIHDGRRALAPTRHGLLVNGVETSDGWMPTRYLVDAAGGGHWLARRLGLRLDRRSPRLIARYGYSSGGDCSARDRAPAIVADSEGWTWIARVHDGVYHWTRLNLAGGPGTAQVPAELRRLRRQDRPRSADVSWRALKRAAGPGYVTVGDAALVLDPASSHGVLRALLTGIHAARLIAAVLADPRREPQLSHAYSRFVIDWFQRDVATLRELYGRLPVAPKWL